MTKKLSLADQVDMVASTFKSPDSLIKGALARDIHGKEVPIDSESACGFCLSGAVAATLLKCYGIGIMNTLDSFEVGDYVDGSDLGLYSAGYSLRTLIKDRKRWHNECDDFVRYSAVTACASAEKISERSRDFEPRQQAADLLRIIADVGRQHLGG